MRLIDADALIDTLQKGQAAAFADNNVEAADQLGLFISIIDFCPTIEVRSGMINREDVLPILAGLARTQEEYNESYDKLMQISPIFKEMQCGQWIQRRNGEYYCSNCGREERFIFQKNYCPKCGAYMRKEGVDND